MQEGLAQLRNRLFRKSPLLQPASDLVASAIELTNALKQFRTKELAYFKPSNSPSQKLSEGVEVVQKFLTIKF